jgi:ArsR family transcriptional regulator
MPENDPHLLAELIKAFAHPTRLLILRELLAGPKCVTDIEDLVPARQANISQHLAVLRFARLVDYAQDGVLRCYYLARPTLVAELLDVVVDYHPLVKRTSDDIKAEKDRAERKQRKAAGPPRRRRSSAKP